MHFLRSCDCTQCYAYIYCNYSIYTEDFDLFHKSADDLTEVLQFLNYHVFVSQVTHWYSRRRRERVEEVTEKVSLVHAHTHSWTSASLRMMCTLRYLLKSFVFFLFFVFLEAVSCRPSCFHALTGSQCNTKWQHRLSCTCTGDTDRTGSDRDLSQKRTKDSTQV